MLGAKGCFSLLISLVIYEELLTLGVATERAFLSGICSAISLEWGLMAGLKGHYSFCIYWMALTKDSFRLLAYFSRTFILFCRSP
jgi:hypothetical protein